MTIITVETATENILIDQDTEGFTYLEVRYKDLPKGGIAKMNPAELGQLVGVLNVMIENLGKLEDYDADISSIT